MVKIAFVTYSIRLAHKQTQWRRFALAANLRAKPPTFVAEKPLNLIPLQRYVKCV